MANENNGYIEDDEILDPADIIVTIELEEAGEIDCMIVSIYTVDFPDGKSQDYITLLEVDPETDEPKEDAELLFYRYYEDEDGMPEIDNIESDEEFEAAAAEFDRIAAEEE